MLRLCILCQNGNQIDFGVLANSPQNSSVNVCTIDKSSLGGFNSLFDDSFQIN